jgi:hypothetical protein
MTSRLRVHARARQLERSEKVLELRAEEQEREREQKRLQCLFKIREKEADIAKSAGRAAAAEARKKVAELETKRQEDKAQKEAEARKEDALRHHYAAYLAGRLERYMFDPEAGAERRRRAKDDVGRAIASRKGSRSNPIPHFWKGDRSGLRNVCNPVGASRRLVKTSNLWASPAFCHSMFKGVEPGGNEAKFAFRKLVERLCPRFFDLFCARYGLETLIAEADRNLDLAFVAAVWRYTHIIRRERYRAGIDYWPPRDEWSRGVVAPLSIAPPAEGAAASSSSSLCARGAEPSAAAAGAASSFTSV